MGPTQPPIQGLRAVSCPGVKWAGREIGGLNVGLLKLQGGGGGGKNILQKHAVNQSALLFDDSKL